MPRAEIASKLAVYTLGLLHAELAGKLLENKREAIRLRTAMMQVEAVVKMLQPGFNVAGIAAKRRNKSNPWFKRGTLFRSAVDVLRRAEAPMTAREIAATLIAGKAPQATRKQAIDLQAAILVALRERNGGCGGWRGRQRGGDWQPRNRKGCLWPYLERSHSTMPRVTPNSGWLAVAGTGMLSIKSLSPSMRKMRV
jgi:hypothetical protein